MGIARELAELGSAYNSGGINQFRNRIINGAMQIDQRNAGASVTPTASAYTLDRWLASLNVASKFSVQQNAGAVTPPDGFTNYLGVTSTSAYSVGASEAFSIQQRIEGFNTADLAFGTSNAKSLTLSFWVRSSLTGTFGGQIFGSPTRSYPFSYSIPVANTWTYITIAIAGDTTVNTYNTTNGFSLIVVFGLGTGSSASGGTVNTWQNGNFTQPTGTVSVVGTNGATLYITGVQLEKGSTATSFDYRPYGTELTLCQRYYYKSMEQTQVPGTVGMFSYRGAVSVSGFRTSHSLKHGVTMRASPSIVLYNPTTGASGSARNEDAAANVSITPYIIGQEGVTGMDVVSGAAGQSILVSYTASAEL
jgi:hypothetical protein